MTRVTDELLSLQARARLPDALRVLLSEFPRETWQGHPNFGDLVQFWLQRHLMFRDLIGRLEADAAAFSDGKQAARPFAARIQRFCSLLLNELHNHHHIEDNHYFPQLIVLDKRLERGFALLETDHEAMDGLINSLANAANTALQGLAATKIETGGLIAYEKALADFHTLLNRHLIDEEEIIVPIILKSGFAG